MAGCHCLNRPLEPPWHCLFSAYETRRSSRRAPYYITSPAHPLSVPDAIQCLECCNDEKPVRQHRGRTPSPAAQSTASRRHRNKPVPPRALRRQAATVPLVAVVVPQPEILQTATPRRALALACRCRSVTGVRHHGLETRSPPSAGVSFLHRSSILVTRAGRCFQGHLHTKLQPLRLSSTSPSPFVCCSLYFVFRTLVNILHCR
jgi:hypothetical protein